MRDRTLAMLLCCLLLTAFTAAPAPAQDRPQECQDAMRTRSPQGQVDLFTACLETGSMSGDPKAMTLKERAIAYMHLGRHQFAVDDLNEAIKIKPGDADNYYLRGFAYRALGQYQKAVEDSNRAVGMDPSFAAAYANRAFANKALGNTSQARSDARRAQALDPSVKVPSF
ncbi:MAG: tetratricopeptide repeat protein [Proteobacteria bacterium]|nr:tetratricopeptide repeat protein [Pseudomonadota bacterium]